MVAVNRFEFAGVGIALPVELKRIMGDVSDPSSTLMFVAGLADTGCLGNLQIHMIDPKDALPQDEDTLRAHGLASLQGDQTLVRAVAKPGVAYLLTAEHAGEDYQMASRHLTLDLFGEDGRVVEILFNVEGPLVQMIAFTDVTINELIGE